MNQHPKDRTARKTPTAQVLVSAYAMSLGQLLIAVEDVGTVNLTPKQAARLLREAADQVERDAAAEGP